ncbi:MAG: DUF4954 family protein [Prevotella sp.]|nr:DUF4954 family protein [Candidatus Prevotella equi]
MYRNLTLNEISTLEAQGCRSTSWTQVQVTHNFETENIRNTRFEGEIRIGENVRIENVGTIRTTDGATFGEDNLISVMNEAGDGNIVLFSGLSSQLAAMMVYNVENKPLFSKIRSLISEHIKITRKPCTTIGNNVTITDCRELTNVIIGDDCELCGASRLIECTLTPTPEATIYIGDDVIMENVIVQAGATIVDAARLYDTFVGEACHVGRGFTSENSVFFANSHMDNGESCAAFCGPFAVSHHKSSLLIGGEYSFYNAGSGTNFSNHAYKMGPIHYGTMDRGAKTASSAHILWPAHIGAFSMAMNKIQSHPDTSLLPFSYVIGDGRKTHVVPGINLCTVGTYRDVMKWPKRDKRPQSGRRSLITFDWLSPYVIERVKTAIRCLEEMQEEQGFDAEEYVGEGFVISHSSLVHGLQYYDLALRMYGNANSTSGWTDLLGLLAPTDAIEQITEDILSDDITNLTELENRFVDIFESYEQWKGYSDNEAEIEQAHEEWLAAIRRDAEKEYNMGDVSEEQIKDFLDSVGS